MFRKKTCYCSVHAAAAAAAAATAVAQEAEAHQTAAVAAGIKALTHMLFLLAAYHQQHDHAQERLLDLCAAAAAAALLLLCLQGTTDSITMLNNGCLCCTVRDDLVNALNKLWERRSSIDHIIIETTGKSPVLWLPLHSTAGAASFSLPRKAMSPYCSKAKIMPALVLFDCVVCRSCQPWSHCVQFLHGPGPA